jgi:hypothetical protein
MNEAITAKIALYKDIKGKYGFQAIVAGTENEYLFIISETQARAISKREDLEIIPIGYELNLYNNNILNS